MKTAIITGGAGGLGQALAADLQGRGWFTVLVDLPGPQLLALPVTSAQRAYGCDLTDGDERAEVFDAIRARHKSIDMVIYNAGVTQIGVFSQGDEVSHRRVFEVNYFAAVETARAFLGDLRQSGGVHLAISSVAGFSPLYSRTTYAASKHALEGFFGSLRSEEAVFGVQVSIAAPSFVATNIGNANSDDSGIARPGSAPDGVDYMSAKDAAAAILKGVFKGKPFIPVGRVARLAWLVNRLSPGLYRRLMERNIRRPQP